MRIIDWSSDECSSDLKRDDVTSSILNKFDAILMPDLRHVLAQQSTHIDLLDVMDEKRILIVNLATGVVGEKHAQFFGALLVSSSAVRRDGHECVSTFRSRGSPYF